MRCDASVHADLRSIAHAQAPQWVRWHWAVCALRIRAPLTGALFALVPYETVAHSCNAKPSVAPQWRGGHRLQCAMQLCMTVDVCLIGSIDSG